MSPEFNQVSKIIAEFGACKSLAKAEACLSQLVPCINTKDPLENDILNMYFNEALTMFATQVASHAMCGTNHAPGPVFTKCIELQTFSCVSQNPARDVMKTLSQAEPCEQCILTNSNVHLLCVIMFLQVHDTMDQGVRGPKFTRAQKASIRTLMKQLVDGNFKKMAFSFDRNFDMQKFI